MAKSKRRKREAGKRAYRKTAEYRAGRGKSRYARKARWLKPRGLFGFQVPEPKPWR